MSNCGALLAIDVDNLFISSAMAGQDFRDYSLNEGFKNLFSWLDTFSDLVAVHCYLSPAQSIKNDELFHELWRQYHTRCLFEVIYCPREMSDAARYIDRVDDHLIDHTQKMADLLYGQIRYVCLASGDLDYSALLWGLKREKGLEIAFALGSEHSFSKAYRQMNLVAKHPHTGEDLIHYFSPREA